MGQRYVNENDPQRFYCNLAKSIIMRLPEILAEYDTLDKRFYEIELTQTLWNSCDNSVREELAYKAEKTAFIFKERFVQNSVGHEVFRFEYKPYNEKVDTCEIDIVDTITPEIIEYWEKRITEAQNPILKARYAGLVWEFKQRITGNKPKFDIARAYIQSLIDITKGEYMPHRISGVEKIKRAIILSASLNDTALLEEAKNALRQLIEIDNNDDNFGIWGVPYIIGNKNPKIYNETEQVSIMADFQTRFNRIFNMPLTNPEKKPNPWLLMDIATILSDYYFKHKQIEKIPELYHKVELAFESISDNLMNLQLVFNLKRVLKSYQKFGLKDEADALNLKIAGYGCKIKNEMAVIGHDFQITKEQMENVINVCLREDIEETFIRFTNFFIPNRASDEEELKNLLKLNPLLSFLPQSIFNDKGRIIAQVGNAENDFEGQLVLYINRKLKLESIYLGKTIEEGKKRNLFSVENTLTFLKKNPAIEADRLPIIEGGLKAYFVSDYIIAVHLLIPQIEAVVRNILESNSVCIYKTDRLSPHSPLRTLDDLLRDAKAAEYLSTPFSYYLRILLTDNKGWNLRNEVCHGLLDVGAFDKAMADRILHCLLCLGNFRSKCSS